MKLTVFFMDGHKDAPAAYGEINDVINFNLNDDVLNIFKEDKRIITFNVDAVRFIRMKTDNKELEVCINERDLIY